MLVSEAIGYGLREGLKLGAVYMALSIMFKGPALAQARRALVFSVLSVLALSFAFTMEPGMQAREFSHVFSGYVFFLFFFGASVALLRFPLAEVPGRDTQWPLWALSLVFLALCAFFAPDILALTIYRSDLSTLKGSTVSVYGSLFAGMLPALWLMVHLGRRFGGRMEKYFGLAQFLMLMVLVKLLLSGPLGFSDASLVPTVQRGVMKFVHDLVHQSFVFLLVPDHPMLKLTVWNFIGFLFGPDLSIFLALLLLLIPGLYYLYASITAPVEAIESGMSGAEARLMRAEARSSRMRRAAPVAVFILLVMGSWYVSGSEEAVRLYMPEPKPLIEDKGMVMVPLRGPGSDLSDGRIHKFSVLVDGAHIRIMVMARPDGNMSVTLDACEICPPEGYGQRDSYVVCVYCMTPIPVDTLGRPGGCNPIPLEATISERDIRVSIEEIRSKWNSLVKANKGVPGE